MVTIVEAVPAARNGGHDHLPELVISGRAGAVLATDSSVIAIYGGDGWTLFADNPPPTTRLTPEYLIRSTEPAVEAIGALPPPSESGAS